MKKVSLTCLILTVIFVIVSVSALIIILCSPTLFFEECTDSNTIEYHLTIRGVEANDKSYSMYVEEFDCGLLFSFDEIISEDYLSELQPGAKITVRISDIWKEILSNSDAGIIYLVALKTDSQEIVTLESHNIYMAEEHRQWMSSAYAFCSVPGVLAIICFIFYLRTRKSSN